MSTKEEIAMILLKEGAVTLRPENPFILVSGLKSPIYTDNRFLLAAVGNREKIVEQYCKTIQLNGWRPDVIAGVATGGIPWASWIATKLNLPMIFVRSSTKDHGKNNQVEGRYKKGDKVIVIEDLISTGKSTLGVVQALRDVGVEVIGCVAIMTYGLKKSTDAFKEANVKISCMTDLPALLKVAIKEKYLDENQKNIVLDWAKDPDSWGAI